MKIPSSLFFSAIVIVCLSGTAHAQPLLSSTVPVTVALLTEPLSVPLGIIGGLGALLLLRPRRRR